MRSHRTLVFGIAAISLGLLAAAPARAASLTMVPRATWGATGVPSYMQMYIYVPDAVAAKPPIYISCHSCGSTATGQISNIPMAKAPAGAMLVQAMLAVYPDLIRAGVARAGVPAGCWADGYASSNQWSNNCAGGNTIKTAQQWGDLVRGMDPG